MANTVFMTDATTQRTYEVVILRYIGKSSSGLRPLADFRRRLIEVRATINRITEERHAEMPDADLAEVEFELQDARIEEAVLLWALKQREYPEDRKVLPSDELNRPAATTTEHPIFGWLERWAKGL